MWAVEDSFHFLQWKMPIYQNQERIIFLTFLSWWCRGSNLYADQYYVKLCNKTFFNQRLGGLYKKNWNVFSSLRDLELSFDAICGVSYQVDDICLWNVRTIFLLQRKWSRLTTSFGIFCKFRTVVVWEDYISTLIFYKVVTWCAYCDFMLISKLLIWIALESVRIPYLGSCVPSQMTFFVYIKPQTSVSCQLSMKPVKSCYL